MLRNMLRNKLTRIKAMVFAVCFFCFFANTLIATTETSNTTPVANANVEANTMNAANATKMETNPATPTTAVATPATSTPTNAATGASATPAPPFEEGKHYQKLSAKITSTKGIQDFIAEDPGKIQVIEFFNYACFWCQRLHPIINEWLAQKPANVVFYRFPVVFHTGWDKLAKAYYMVEQLGKSDTLDKEFFDAVHVKHLNLADEKLLKEFFISHGVTDEVFDAMYNSFAVNQAVTRGNELSNEFQITLSPVLVVNMPSGSYLISAPLVGTEKGVIDVLNYLIEKEAKGSAN